MTHSVQVVEETSLDTDLFPLVFDPEQPKRKGQFRNRNVPLTFQFPAAYRDAFPNGEREHPLLIQGVASQHMLYEATSVQADALGREYRDSRLLLVIPLEGAKTYAEDLGALLRPRGVHVTLATLKAGSYRGKEKNVAGTVIQQDLTVGGKEITDLDGYRILVADDILDSGDFIKYIVAQYLRRDRFANADPNPRAAFLLEKRVRRSEKRNAYLEEVTFGPTAISAPDLWLVGYGLDVGIPGNERLPSLHLFRTLPSVYAFNANLLDPLTQLYHRDPQYVNQALDPFISLK